MQYRPEIDGLRAVAVVPVVLFHAGFNLFSGGYVGVDVFFVISGYLITTIIREEIAQGKFTLKNFYLRRIRRIIPLLYFVTLLTVIGSWVMLTPSDFDSFTKSVLGVTTFSSNIVFWLQSGYFDTATELKPLLHTWSLAVEEQFYVFFPLLLLFLSKYRIAVLWVVVIAILLTSLVVAENLSFSHPEFAFYQLVTRAWELMLGAVAAVVAMENWWTKNKPANEAISMIGILMVIYAIGFYEEQTPFPGFYAVIPTLGTSLIILSTRETTLVSKFLSLKTVTLIGLLSYSIYLWHQPILAFARYNTVGELNAGTAWLIVLAVLPISYISWKFIELPCRKNLSLKSGLLTLAIAFLCSLILVIASTKTNGFNYRVTVGVYDSTLVQELDLEILGKQDAVETYDIAIRHKGIGAMAIRPKTLPVNGRVLILGDSHAMHLETGFAPFLANKYGLEIVINYSPGCNPTIGYFKIYDIEQKRERSRQQLCREQVVEWKSYLEKKKDVFDVVILAGRWNWLVNESDYGPRKVREDGLWPIAKEPVDLSKIREKRVTDFKNAITQTLKYIDQLDLKVIFVSQAPLLYKHVKSCDVLNNGACAAPSYDEAAQRQSKVDEVLQSIKPFESKNIIHFRPFGIFCNERERNCVVSKNKYIYYKDRNHLSGLGSLKLAKELVRLHPGFFDDLTTKRGQ